MSGIESTATSFHRACVASNVPFVVVGGFAVAAWGEPRATRDVDALVDLRESDVPAFADELKATGLSVSPQDLVDAIREGGHATVFDDATGYHVDIKIARSPQEKAEVQAGVEIDLPSGRLRVVRPEETIAFKLLYGTPLDVQDARSILARQGDRLDGGRLAALAVKLGVVEPLERLRSEVERARKRT